MDETTLLGKIVTFVMVGMLGWLGVTVQDVSVQVAIQGVQVAAIKDSIAVSNLGRYTKTEAEAALAILEGRIERLESWVEQER